MEGTPILKLAMVKRLKDEKIHRKTLLRKTIVEKHREIVIHRVVSCPLADLSFRLSVLF